MAEFSKLNGYDVKDATARQALTGKVNTTDIVDALTSDAANKPLSAKQGKALDERLKVLEDAPFIHITPTSKGQDCWDALESENVGGRMGFVDTDSDEVCNLIAIDITNAPNKLVFFKTSTLEIVNVCWGDLSATVTVERIKVDKPIKIEYANEELTISE